MMRPCLTSITASLVLAACVTSSYAREQAAVIVQPNEHSRAALQRSVNSMFGGINVPLADDALTRDSSLFIEHVRPRDSEGRLIQGRELRTPEKILLVKNGKRCILIRESTGKRLRLAETKCVPKA